MSDHELPQGTHTVVMGIGDLNGIMRGKRMPSTHWETICKSGNAFSMVLLAMDMTCDVWDTPYANFDNGFPDMHLFPLTKPVSIPWEPGVAICLARAEGKDHNPVPIDPRNVLVTQVERAASMGYELKVGTELEFYLLDPETMLPRDKGIGVYGLDRAAELEHVLGPIRQQINEMGIPIEQSNPEYAPGQAEVNILYDSALLAADRVIMFRSLVKQLAKAHGYHATFMAKPFYEHAGSGFHLHHSLWKDGENAFAEDGKLNSTGMHYLAGMQSRMAEMSICGSTTPNAYRRRQVNSFCPINTCWGLDNRSAGLRVIEGSNNAVRIEKRDGSADCNPYLIIAADLAAGLDGIESKMTPTPRTEGNAYFSKHGGPLPLDIAEAVRLARESTFLKELCGNDLYEILVQQSEREMDFCSRQVTPTAQ